MSGNITRKYGQQYGKFKVYVPPFEDPEIPIER
jgi:hypothetical protein